MKNIRAFVFIFTMIFALTASAQDPSVMSLVRKNYSGMGAATASFDLSIYWDVREREEKKSGELIIAPGNKFKVTIGKEVFVSDGKTYWQYSEKNSQVVIRNFSDIDKASLPSNMLSSFLSGRKFEEKKRGGGTVELAWSGGKSGNAGADAGLSDGYTAITAVIEEKGGVIKSLRMTDRSNNIHTYTFKKTAFDKAPKDDVFKFTAPRGAEVIDMRENQ